MLLLLADLLKESGLPSRQVSLFALVDALLENKQNVELLSRGKLFENKYQALWPDTDVIRKETDEVYNRICEDGKFKEVMDCLLYTSDFDALLKLPGVGRKSANLIMGDVFGKPAIVTDTHCIRLSNRIGLVDNMKEPKKVEMALWKIIPPEEGNDLCHRLVNHGRDVCTARTKPYCDRCCLNDICEKNGVDSQE